MTRYMFRSAALLLFWQSVFSSELSFKSPVGQVGVLELYTSEGCSSCPPADRWLSSLLDDEQLWQEFIPLAFHVDYWDYLGWTDRFASAEFSERQREYARQKAIPTVYTPGFVFNGHERRNWFLRQAFDFSSGERPGVLTLVVGDGVADVSFQPTAPGTGKLEAYVALLGFGLSTKVAAGENAGRGLTHDFVVLGMQRRELMRNGDELSAIVELPDIRVTAPHRAVVAWISENSDQAPLQAVGGWLDGS